MVKTEVEAQAKEFMNEFRGSLTNEISISDIRPALSAQVPTYTEDIAIFSNWTKGLGKLNKSDYKLCAYTHDMLIAVLGKRSFVDWGDFQNVENLTWDLIVVYYDARKKRIFADVRRLMIINVGARKFHGKDISFQSFFGSSVQDGISEMTVNKLIKNNVFGIGYRNGVKQSLGCSSKGKLWSRERANLFVFKLWCDSIGNLITNESIYPDTVLTNSLKYKTINKYPTHTVPIDFDWPDGIYENSVLKLRYGRSIVNFDEFSISIDSQKSNSDYIYFHLECDEFNIDARCSLKPKGAYYEIVWPLDKPIGFVRGNNCDSIDDFFKEFTPRIYFADGSLLFGNHLVENPTSNPKLNVEDLIPKNWNGVDKSIESQGSDPNNIKRNSIQYVFSKMICDFFNVIIDDDGSVEVADLIGINERDNCIDITMFHLKFAIGGKVSRNINNLYQVAGQAIKSIQWKYRQGRTLFDSLLERDERKRKHGKVSSILKGEISDVMRYREQALNSRELKFNVAIVQPGMSKSNCSEKMLIVLGNVQQYLEDVSAIDLKIYCSK